MKKYVINGTPLRNLVSNADYEMFLNYVSKNKEVPKDILGFIKKERARIDKTRQEYAEKARRGRNKFKGNPSYVAEAKYVVSRAQKKQGEKFFDVAYWRRESLRLAQRNGDLVMLIAEKDKEIERLFGVIGRLKSVNRGKK